jgi:hypothetical protein
MKEMGANTRVIQNFIRNLENGNDVMKELDQKEIPNYTR